MRHSASMNLKKTHPIARLCWHVSTDGIWDSLAVLWRDRILIAQYNSDQYLFSVLFRASFPFLGILHILPPTRLPDPIHNAIKEQQHLRRHDMCRYQCVREKGTEYVDNVYHIWKAELRIPILSTIER